MLVYTAEPDSPSQVALSLLASWTANDGPDAAASQQDQGARVRSEDA
jgi:hypothetical protein